MTFGGRLDSRLKNNSKVLRDLGDNRVSVHGCVGFKSEWKGLMHILREQ